MRKRGVEVPRLADEVPEDLELKSGMGLQYLGAIMSAASP